VQRAEREVAGRDVLDYHARAEDIVHLGKGKVLLDHLAVSGVDVLLAAEDFGADVRFGELALDRVERLADHFAPVAARRAGRLGEHLVAPGIKVREGELLQLVVKRVQAEAVGDRRVDLHRFARHAPALGGRHRAQGAHVVQPVGELDEDDAHVARHRQQHLAEVLRLRVLGRLELDAVQLRDTVDQFRDGFSKGVGDLVLGDRGVLGDIVEQRRHQRLPVEVPLGEDLGHRQRVRNIGVARLAGLAGVRGFREAVSLGEARHVLRLQVAETGRIGELHGRNHAARLPRFTAWARREASDCASGPRCRPCRSRSRAGR
jgi:hypothetical protein